MQGKLLLPTVERTEASQDGPNQSQRAAAPCRVGGKGQAMCQVAEAGQQKAGGLV